MHIIRTVQEMHTIASQAREAGLSIGCVPTMGALHNGHAKLIKQSSIRHPITVVTVFVNPKQFGPSEDFDKYPRDLEADVHLIKQSGGTHVFAPSVEEMYPDGFATTVHAAGVADLWEGASRPGHFDGVVTVVTKLFNAVIPSEAFFGQKDYQQTLVIKRMVADLSMNTMVTVVPTVREKDGLALSSRNRYLSDNERLIATSLYTALIRAREYILDSHLTSAVITRAAIEQIMHNELSKTRIDYATAVDSETMQQRDEYKGGEKVLLMIAAFVGSTRLIDNIVVKVP